MEAGVNVESGVRPGLSHRTKGVGVEGVQITRDDKPEGYVYVATYNMAEYLYSLAQRLPMEEAIAQMEDCCRVNIDKVRGTPCG
jgi:hypothetical protein